MKNVELFADENGDWAEIIIDGKIIFSDHESNLSMWRLEEILDNMGLDIKVSYSSKEFD